jgi:hypothetical protein
MDLEGSEAAARRDATAFMAFIALLRTQVDPAIYPSLLGRDSGEGDSIRQAFTDLREALQCAFLLRHAAQRPVQAEDGLYTLTPRLALHFDEFHKREDDRIEGVGQILVTRLDHAVPPGEILATEAFTNVARYIGADRGYSFEDIGKRKLGKNAGEYPCYIVTLR